ncbi:unnamed protein product [Sphacelaria rigidula]
MEKQQKDAADFRRKQQEMARLEEMAKARAKDQAAKAAQAAADQKQRELDQKKHDQQARALRQKQLDLEREKEAKRVKATAALDKAKRDAVAKKADAEKKRREHMEARARLLRHKTEEAEKAKKKQVSELEKGIEKIAGMSTDSVDLSGLDRAVLLELEVFIKASGGHRILPAIVKMIELKSKKEEEKEAQNVDAAADDEEKPMTDEKIHDDFLNNVRRITGIEKYGLGSMIALDMDVLEELLAYTKTLTTGRLAGFAQDVKGFIFWKKLITVGKQCGVMIIPGFKPERVDWSGVDVMGMDKIIEFLKSEPRFGERWLNVIQVVRQSKVVELAAQREAAEEALATKQAAE